MGAMMRQGQATRIALALMFCTSADAKDTSPSTTASEVANARDYMFAACITDRYRGMPLAAEANVLAAGLVENGSLSAAAYGKLYALAKRLAPPPEGTSTGQIMRLGSCMDLYNDPRLPTEIRRVIAR